MKEPRKKREFFSRRRFVQLGASLFAFVPAIKYLAQPPLAFARADLEECEEVECDMQEIDCANYDCWDYNTYYEVFYCYDYQTGVLCYPYFYNTGEPC